MPTRESPAFDPSTLSRPEFSRGTDARPLITIGIPAYDRPNLLAEALASIAAQEEFTDFEVVVSDDGGRPEARQAVEACAIGRIRYYVNRPALGPVDNWNHCIELAAGQWVTVLHEDDVLYPWFLKTVAARLRESIAAVSVKCIQGTETPALAGPGKARALRRYHPLWFLKASMTPFPGVVFQREIARSLGGFDRAEGGLADYAFWYGLACHGGIETIRQTAAFYRVNPGQWTERAWPSMLRRAHLLRLRIAREQLPRHRRLGRWLARFYTARMARAYARRFSERPAVLTRAQRFTRMPGSSIPSGWVWAALQWLPKILG